MKKTGHKFESDKGRIHGTVWRKEREEGNDLIIISKIKEICG